MITTETWNVSRLDSMISSKIEENLSLDYKAADAIDDADKKKREITKDVSAMANSNGGTIIYGMAEHVEEAKRHLPEKIDPINRLQFSKEWLEHVISNIKPRIESLRIVPIGIPTNPDHVVYVVEIPKSTTAHQALDFRYYRRYNFESVPMLDYEIRDVMNRQRFPKLAVSASLQFGRGEPKGTLHFEVQNIGDVLARHFLAIIHVPVPLRWRGNVILFKEGILDNLEDGSAIRLNFSNGVGGPIFPQSSRYMNFEFGIGTMRPEPKKTIQEIRYKVFADAMPFVEGKFEPDQIFKELESF